MNETDMMTQKKNVSSETKSERELELKLLYRIMQLEHENKHSKEFTDKQMQERIKKIIQTNVTSAFAEEE